jgi:carbon monoxide dehydrogenase subunit G
MATLLDERNFVVDASQERVWRLIGKVIFSSLPGMERMEILDENNFRSLLITRVMGAQVTLKLKGEMVDVEPPDSFSVKLFLEGPGGMFKADQKVSFAMTPIDATKTRVACKAVMEQMGLLPGLLLTSQARSFARSTFEAIEKRLKELA